MQVSKEFKIQYNPSLANGSRLISLDVAGAPVNRTREYTLATVDYLAGVSLRPTSLRLRAGTDGRSQGGDNYMPEVAATEFVVLDTLDEVLLRYINKTSPVNAALDGRIAITNATKSTNNTIDAAPTSSRRALTLVAAAGVAAALPL